MKTSVQVVEEAKAFVDQNLHVLCTQVIKRQQGDDLAHDCEWYQLRASLEQICSPTDATNLARSMVQYAATKYIDVNGLH